MSFSDGGYLITLGTPWMHLLWLFAVLAVIAWIACRDYNLKVSWAMVPLAIACAVAVAWHQGARIQLLPDGIRETRWYREIDFVAWRHVASASVEARNVESDSGTVSTRRHLVLRLRTGDDWLLDLEELRPVEIQRIGAFVNEHVAVPPLAPRGEAPERDGRQYFPAAAGAAPAGAAAGAPEAVAGTSFIANTIWSPLPR